MSFRCQTCKQPQVAGTRPNLVVVEIRAKEYAVGGSVIPGHETVRELRLCEPCATVAVDKHKEYVKSHSPDMSVGAGVLRTAISQVVEGDSNV